MCTAIIAASTLLMQNGQVAEAAMLEPYYEGLVGWWSFDEGTGTVAKDSSGNANDGTIYGATLVDGKYGKALSFDGVDDYVEVADSRTLNVSVFTITAWVKLSSYSEFACPIVDRASVDGGYALWLRGVAPVGSPHLNGGNGNDAVAYGLTVGLNEWTFVAVVFNGSTATFYVNDEAGAGIGNYEFRDIGSLTTRIGQVRWAWSGQYFNGIIDDVRIYNRTLSQTEINGIFQNVQVYHRNF